MVRLVHIGIIFFATLFAFLFLASAPIRETYAPTPPKNGNPARTETKSATSTDKVTIKPNTENTLRITDVVSKITETVTDLQKRVSSTTNTTIPAPVYSPEEINLLARDALVNIYCTTQVSGATRLITGSGVVIDPRGIVLTNTHVAQTFLFEDVSSFGATDCIVRAGSPAAPAYDAEILYISPSWIKENASALKQENPLGTGENDFALLHITRSLKKGVPLPEQFSHLIPELDRAQITLGSPVLLASYPAGFLGSIAVQKDLYQTSVITEIKELFTFKSGLLDLFSLSGNAVAQKGSSGSAVVSLHSGKVLGIIVTSSEGETTADRELHAIVFSHMSESMSTDIEFTLEEYLATDPTTASASFQKNIAPLLLELLSS